MPTSINLLNCLRRRRGLAPVGLILAGLGVAYGRTLAPGVTWANGGADSGDLITATAVLGVAHPTGYPTYLLLARLFQLIPLGDLAFRTNIFSASAAVLAALCAYALARALLADQGWRAAVAAGSAALSLGLSPVFWSQAVVAEVHSLNALLAALLLLWTLRSMRGPASAARWFDRLAAPVAGLALGNHVMIALPAAVWFVAASMRDRAADRLRVLAGQLAGVGLGLLVYAYLPLRAAAHPPVNWGDPSTLDGFWWTVSGRPYQALAFGLPRELVYGRAEAWAGLLAQQFGWLGLGLGFYGLLYGAPGERRFVWLTAAIAGIYSIFAITYNTADSYAYLIPVYMIFAIWIGLGVSTLLGFLERHAPRIAPLAALLLTIGLLWPAAATARRVDASQDRRAIAFARQALAAPARAIMLTASDEETFPLWYYHYALGERPDLAVVVAPLLEFDWYRRNLHAVYPDLQIPERPATPWVESLIAANGGSRRACRTDPHGARALVCSAPGR